MNCCGKSLGEGQLFVMRRFWCTECNTEHLVDAHEITEWLARHVKDLEAQNGQRLPPLL